jgi:Glutamyl-tRNAGlu reductase, dimerisation domain
MLDIQGKPAPGRLPGGTRDLEVKMTSRYPVREDGVVGLPELAMLRARADGMVAVELVRLRRRRPELNDEQAAEVSQTLHQVVRQILHHPTALLRRTLDEPSGVRYRSVLSVLFGLTAAAPPGSAGDMPDRVAPSTATTRPTACRVRPDLRPTRRTVPLVSSWGGRLDDSTPTPSPLSNRKE